MEISNFLDNLESRAEDGFARMVFAGHAISKSKENLHLAVSSGVLSIPISEIELVLPMSEVKEHSNYVYVSVKNADRVKHLLTAEQLSDQGPSDDQALRFGSIRSAGPTERMKDGRDTYTRCPPNCRFDATDDVPEVI